MTNILSYISLADCLDVDSTIIVRHCKFQPKQSSIAIKCSVVQCASRYLTADQCCDLETMVSRLEFILPRSWSRDLKSKVSVLVSIPRIGLGLETVCLVPMPVARLP